MIPYTVNEIRRSHVAVVVLGRHGPGRPEPGVGFANPPHHRPPGCRTETLNTRSRPPERLYLAARTRYAVGKKTTKTDLWYDQTRPDGVAIGRRLVPFCARDGERVARAGRGVEKRAHNAGTHTLKEALPGGNAG
jgi:hypothetical protein